MSLKYNKYTTSENQNQSTSDQNDEFDLARLWTLLISGRNYIITSTIIAVILGLGYALIKTPSYKVNSLLQMEMDHSTSPLSGMSSDLAELAGASGVSLSEAEMEIMTSRAVLGQTVDDLNLEISANPKYFPIIGEAITRYKNTKNRQSNLAFKGKSRDWLPYYAWQKADIKISKFNIPERFINESFKLRALGDGKYALYDPKGRKILDSKVNKLATTKLLQGGKLKIYVNHLDYAGSFPVDFEIKRTHRLSAISDLEKKLDIEEKGKDTGIISIAQEGVKRAHIQNVINSVADNYLWQNIKTESQQAKKSLQFLNAKLPKLRDDVQEAENKLAQYQKENNQPVDLSQSAQALLGRDTDLQKQKEEIQLKLAELRHQFSDQHPRVQSLKKQLSKSEYYHSQLKKKLNRLPDTEKELLKLQRDVRVKTDLYTSLLNRAQELRIMQAGTVGNVHIVDHAEYPVKSIAPRKKIIIAVMLVLGFFIGFGIVLLRSAIRQVINDPAEIENQLGIPLYAVVPYSRQFANETQMAARLGYSSPILARDHSESILTEAIRSLRTSLYFTQMEQQDNTIIITGPAPGIGKSFISINLAWLLAKTGQRVILVDTDMRKGRLHNYFSDKSREPGLSQVLTKQVTLPQVTRSLGDNSLDIITSGAIPTNPAELLMSDTFSNLISDLKQRYDIVILDAPPVLAVTDAAIMTGIVSNAITFLVAKANTHTISELQESVKRLNRQGHGVTGLIFNGYKKSHAREAGQYGYNYHYEYKSDS